MGRRGKEDFLCFTDGCMNCVKYNSLLQQVPDREQTGSIGAEQEQTGTNRINADRRCFVCATMYGESTGQPE